MAARLADRVIDAADRFVVCYNPDTAERDAPAGDDLVGVMGVVGRPREDVTVGAADGLGSGGGRGGCGDLALGSPQSVFIWSSMSNARRHFSRWRTCSGTPARARRARTCSTLSASTVLSSQEAGQNSSRQFAAIDAVSVTICTLTPIWQFAVLPNVPEYIRATSGEALPSFGKPVSSMTYASGPIISAPHPLARTAS